MQSYSKDRSSTHLWRNDITGLRALAVIPVLIYHAFPEFVPGGFFGVDIFFVISGYLISGIIFRSVSIGTFSYLDFYQKRIRRIIPNLITLCLFVLIVGFFVLLPREYENLGQHIVSSGLFVQNFRLLSEVGYFTEDALRKPLLHLWSLAVEEQFYIFFPILIAVLWKLFKSKRLIGILVICITLASLVASFFVEKGFGFYFPLTRFWEIGAGIIVAYLETYGIADYSKISQSIRSFLSVLALSVLIWLFFFYKTSMPHPGGVTLVPVLASVILICAHPNALVNRTLLSLKPMTFVGLISYSLYLWHWPLLCFLFICLPESGISITYKLLALLISFLLATLIYKYVENPLRRMKSFRDINLSLLLMTLLACLIAGGFSLSKYNGLPSRNFVQNHLEMYQIAEARVFHEWTAYDKLARIRINGVKVGVTSKSSYPKIVFLGDSHMAQYQLRINRLASSTNVTAATLALRHIWRPDTYNGIRPAILKIMSDPKVEVIVIASRWFGYMSDRSGKGSLAELAELCKTYTNKKVFILLDPPWDSGSLINGRRQQGQFDPMKHFNRVHYQQEDFLVPYPKELKWKKGNEMIEDLFHDVAKMVKVENFVCEKQFCDTLKYKDDDHLNPFYLEKNATWLDEVFASVKD